MKTLFFVNAAIAIVFGIFIELVKLSDVTGFSPWWIAVAYFGLFIWWGLRSCATAPVCAVAMNGGMGCPDCLERISTPPESEEP